jgi:hypothetical protein
MRQQVTLPNPGLPGDEEDRSRPAGADGGDDLVDQRAFVVAADKGGSRRP